MADLWEEIDDAVIACLAAGHEAPDEIGRRLGMSEAGASSILAMLLAQGKVRICRVSLVDRAMEELAQRSSPAADRRSVRLR